MAEPQTTSLGYRARRLILLLLLLAGSAFAQNAPILLWPNGAPGSEGKTAGEAVRVTENGEHIVSSVHRPSITPFLPSKENATGAAVIIAPGGGHRELWMDHEGYNVARWLSQDGVAAFVLYGAGHRNGELIRSTSA